MKILYKIKQHKTNLIILCNHNNRHTNQMNRMQMLYLINIKTTFKEMIK